MSPDDQPVTGAPVARDARATGQSALLAGLLAAALVGLGGCSSQSWSSVNPINWWHGLEGGAIAQQRPPPPGANEPPPNLATVPPKPAEPDRLALQDITDSLIGDRTNAQHMAAAAPLVDPSSPSAAPGLFGVGTVPPPGPPPPAPPPGQPSATLPVANSPPAPLPAPAAPPSKAPVSAVQSAPLTEPTRGPNGTIVEPPSPAAEASLPPLPTAAPPPAAIPGMPVAPNPPPIAEAPTPAQPVPPVAAPTVASTASTTASAAPTPAAPSSVSAPPPRDAATAQPAAPVANPVAAAVASATPSATPPSTAKIVTVVFANGSSVLPPSAPPMLRGFAGRRGNAVIAVTGYGDAQDASPDAQAAALKLGLARAQSIAAALTGAGVPASAVQIDAQATGRGGTARFLQ